MQRVTVTLDEELVAEIDRFMTSRGYQNRSEAVRDLARMALQQSAEEAGSDGDCVAALIYVYDHHVRDLPKRLAEVHHDHHDLSVATTHVHLDHDWCLEVALLKGQSPHIRDLAQHIIVERGVRHGKLVVVPVETTREKHRHGATGAAPHSHSRVRHAGST